MKKIILAVMAGFVLLGFSQQSFAAPMTQVDALIKKLVEKGILTQDDADKIKGEIIDDEKTLREKNAKSDLPQWVQDMKLSGDLRVRYQDSRRHTEDSSDVDRSIGRIRARLGLDTKINDTVKVGIGIAGSETHAGIPAWPDGDNQGKISRRDRRDRGEKRKNGITCRHGNELARRRTDPAPRRISSGTGRDQARAAP